MFNLVKNELTKIFSKKAIYIVLLVFLGLSVLVLGLQKYGESISMIASELDLTDLKEELKDIDTSTESGKMQYWYLKSEIETRELANQYGGYSTWQGEKIFEYIYPIKMDMNLYENELDEFAANTSYSEEQIQKEYDKIMHRIKSRRLEKLCTRRTKRARSANKINRRTNKKYNRRCYQKRIKQKFRNIKIRSTS